MTDPGIVTPHSLDAERSVLGGILIHPAALADVVGVIGADDFFRDANARIFRHCQLLQARGQDIDLITLKDSLANACELDACDGPAYLASLIDGVPRSQNVGEYARIIKEKARARTIIGYCRQAIETFSTDPSALSNGAGTRFSEAIRRGVDDAHAETSSLTVLAESDLAQMPTPTYVIDELIPDGITALVAPAGVGKTTFMIAAAVSRAIGRQFLGRAIPRIGPTLLVLGEGASKAPARIRAAKVAAGFDPDADVGLFVVPHPVNFFEGGPAYEQLRRFIEPMDPRPVLAIDTFSINTVGSDENSAADVTKAFGNIRALQLPTLIAHHMDKNGRAERGSSAFRANCDALLTLLDVDDLLTLTCEKMRDGAAFDPMRLKLFEVPETGACSIRLAGDMLPSAALSPAQRQALDALVAAFPAGGDGATRAEWYALVPTLKERTFYHAAGRLRTTGFVTERRGRFVPAERRS